MAVETERPEATGENPRRNGVFPIDHSFCGFGGLDGGVRSQIRTRLRGQFPANREINREIRDSGGLGDDFEAINRCAAGVSRIIP